MAITGPKPAAAYDDDFAGDDYYDADPDGSSQATPRGITLAAPLSIIVWLGLYLIIYFLRHR
jgi:hypothetical protein